MVQLIKNLIRKINIISENGGIRTDLHFSKSNKIEKNQVGDKKEQEPIDLCHEHKIVNPVQDEWIDESQDQV